MILVVEDNSDDSFLLTRQLARANLADHVRVIGNGQDALNFLLESSDLPMAIFLDLRLPGLSGIELLERVRGDARLHDLAIVVMTGSVDPTDVETCTRLGVTSYLPKPVSLETFAKIIGEVVSALPPANPEHGE